MTAKSSRKHTVPLKTKLKKDPGIPRLPNLKVRNAEKQKARAPPPTRVDIDSVMASEPTLETLANLPEEEPQEKTKEQLRKHYFRALHKVIDQSDIVILVLDARDPEGCRSRIVEEEVRRREAEGKKLVFVLNKVDLISSTNAQQWLKYLRHSTPTLPFRAPSSAQHQRTNISSSTAPALIKLLKAYKPSAGSITVGVVGYPNVGKSSLINCLKRSKVCGVAAQPGHTKDLQSVQLERGMRIIDSPGVVFDDEEQKAGNILLRNVVKVEDIEDPIAVDAVEEIVQRTPAETLEKLYNLPHFTSTIEFLTMTALSSGRLLKGGTADINATARQIINDWNHQKIPYFSEPPVLHPSSIPSTIGSGAATIIAPGAEQVGQAKILTEFSAPFSLPGLFEHADAGAFGGDVDMTDNNNDNVEMDEDEDNDVFVDAMDEDEFAAQAFAQSVMARKRPRSPSPMRAVHEVEVCLACPNALVLSKRCWRQMQAPPSPPRANRKRKTPPPNEGELPHIVHPIQPTLPPGYQYNADFTPIEPDPPPAPAGRVLSTSKRAEQNRKAQRAFRERRDQHVKQLESRSALLDAALASADEANRRWEECRVLVDQLRVENAALRAALTQQAQLIPGVEKKPESEKE
ncbi:Proteophosphoglycan ppg4 [Mycena indigotica]|uniref:Proteophosphoglycan ppg4 n=1 Tax=Mycena indigotica TaxID=2126181 RepID=A0A8H6TDN8_9AGAR|nr:Proteophosphoglycan ppg4 [Mycena indigotica]KAF7315379.1 Proteophosphoglycan ppg4 [Mycena indigotica]